MKKRVQKQHMSDYFRTLDTVDLNHYIQKLKLLNLTEQDDPYLHQNCERFFDDMKKSCPIELGNITNDKCIILLSWFCTQFSFLTALVHLVHHFLSLEGNPKNLVPLLLLEELTINHATMVWYLFYTQMGHGTYHHDNSMTRFCKLMEVINLNKLS